MNSRGQNILRILTVLLSIGIVVLMVAIVMAFAKGLDKTPRTEAQRAVVEAEEAVSVNPNDATSRVKLAAAYLSNGAVGAAREQAAPPGMPRQPPDAGGGLPVTRLTRVPTGIVVAGEATPLMMASSSSGIVDG
jgi:hypothetical protein